MSTGNHKKTQQRRSVLPNSKTKIDIQSSFISKSEPNRRKNFMSIFERQQNGHHDQKSKNKQDLSGGDKKDAQNPGVQELAKGIEGLSLEEAKTLENKQNENKSPVKNTENQESQPSNAQNEKKFTSENSPNLFFYLNKIKSKPKGTFLEDMHKNWWGDYDELEDNHSYIQWLFPNFYRSDFNISAYKLEQHEAIEFRNDIKIAENLVKSYELILDFYGMKLKSKNTGELERTEKYKKRYKDALLTYFHNHLRIRRILTHLNNVGFRRYAVQLVNFLEKEIYGEVGGYKKFTEGDKSFNKKAFEEAPLQKLSKMTKVFPTWAMYGDHYNDPKRIELLEQNCFGKYPEDFQDSVYFRHFHG